MKPGVDIPALVGGLVTVGLGLLLLLDRVSVLHLGFVHPRSLCLATDNPPAADGL